MSDPVFDPIEAAVVAVARGEIVVVADDEDRENEGDLIMAADAATPEAMAFFVRHTSGVICAALPEDRCDQLGLPLMVPPADNSEVQGTAFTVTVDLREGTTTGISAADRAATLRALAAPASRPADFNRPGHIFPLRARAGGVLTRPGHTEAAVDLARLAGRAPAGVLCEVVADGPGGGMARVPELRAFADRHGLVLVSIADLVRHRQRAERALRPLADTRLPTPWAEFRALAFADPDLAATTHLALILGDVADTTAGRPAPLVRLHSECLTGDVFASQRCDCGGQLHGALELIASEGRGVVVYLRGHEGRGIGLGHKLRAYELQEVGLDTVDANAALGFPVDARDYAVAAPILQSLGVRSVRLATNNPAKAAALEAAGVVVERVPATSAPHPEALRYLRTKRDRMGHLLPSDDVLGLTAAKEIR